MNINIERMAKNIHIRPTDKKMRQAKQIIGKSGLPIEMPIEKDIFVRTEPEIFDNIKNRIQITIDNMQRNNIVG